MPNVRRVRLALGVGPERAIAEIKQLAGGKAAAIRVTSREPVDLRNDYVRWAMDTEARLESLLRREDAQAFFDDPRHRDICSSFLGHHLTTMIHSELGSKARDLEEAAAYLEGHLDRMRRAGGLPVVPDSNALLQGQRLDYVKWTATVQTEARVMLPLRVIEEIDAKKYSNNDRLRARARELLPWINRLFPDGDTGPVMLREDDATIELLLADRPRHRPDDADEEILDVCHDVVRFAGRGRLMTGDTSMRLRAISEGLEVLFLSAGRNRGAGETSGSR